MTPARDPKQRVGGGVRRTYTTTLPLLHLLSNYRRTIFLPYHTHAPLPTCGLTLYSPTTCGLSHLSHPTSTHHLPSATLQLHALLYYLPTFLHSFLLSNYRRTLHHPTPFFVCTSHLYIPLLFPTTTSYYYS